MKKIIICFLSLCLLWTTPLNVFADSTYDYDESTKITVSVPEKHKIEIETDLQEGIVLYMDGKAVNSAEVDRLSEHTFTMNRFGENGREIKQVFLNGEDITDEIFGEGFTIPSVHENLEFSVVYADEDVPSTTETTTTNTIAETSENTTHSELQTTTKSTSATTVNQSNNNSPKTGDNTPFVESIFLIISVLCVCLSRKKDDNQTGT